LLKEYLMKIGPEKAEPIQATLKIISVVLPEKSREILVEH
jgi:hypothetical protein